VSAPLDIIFLNSHTLGDPITLTKVLHAFMSGGFSIEEFKINDRIITWHGDPESVRKLVALAYEARDCYFLAWNAEWSLEIRQHIAWDSPEGEKEAWICTTTDNTPYFWHTEKNPSRYSRFYLDIGKELYKVLRPSFGWIDFDYGLRTTHEDLRALNLPTLYWANFFGPEYVDKIGKSKILGAPAWKIEQLDEGGILYVLSSCPGLADDHVPIESVQAHFGVKNVR
jgi:hypothetical protein